MSFDQITDHSTEDSSMFELAPVSLWLEDASGVKTLFETWQAAGMISLREWLQQPDRLWACLSELKILKVNKKTLALFEASDFSEFATGLPRILTAHSLECIIEQWVELWDGQSTFFGKTVNTTLTGRILDVQIRGSLLPGHERNWGRVLIAIEDVTDLEEARRAAAASESHARGLFEHSPLALWVKDFSAVKHLLDKARVDGIVDLGSYFQIRPDFARRCLDAIRVIDVNRQAIQMFGAHGKDHLLNTARWGPDQSYGEDLKTELLGLWDGKLFQQRDIVDRTLDGREIYVQIQMSVLPGHETDWAKVQIARIDISERKRAEAHLRYVGIHDPVTTLYNRSFFIERLGEIEASESHPVTILMIDLNGLKTINDMVGHAAGDAMLRRTSEILLEVAKGPFFATRLGGDEFAIVMPNADEIDGQTMIQAVGRLIELDNQVTPQHRLSISIGAATSRPSERLEDVVSRADKAMYDVKAFFYANLSGRRADDDGRPPMCATM